MPADMTLARLQDLYDDVHYVPPIQKLGYVIANLDESIQQSIIEQSQKLDVDIATQQDASRQLEDELEIAVHAAQKNGICDSFLFQRLPPELRHQIFAHVVRTPTSVHVYPPQINDRYGYRLSLCEEPSYDFNACRCRCTSHIAPVRSAFFDNSVFLVSKDVRREAINAFLSTNHFTFVDLFDLARFTEKFPVSTSKIQRLRLLESADDHEKSPFTLEMSQKARGRLKSLKDLELYMCARETSQHEKLWEDGLVQELVYFALGPPPAAEKDNDSGEPRRRRHKRTLGAMLGRQVPESTFYREVLAQMTKKLKQSAVEETSEDTKTTKESALIPVSSPFDGPREPSEDRESLATTQATTPTVNSVAVPQLVPMPKTFTIPALRKFTATVNVRSSSWRPSRQDPAKLAANELLSVRLTSYLTDVFTDAGKKYQTVEDVPPLMKERPAEKVHDWDRTLTGAEKRGLLILGDEDVESGGRFT